MTQVSADARSGNIRRRQFHEGVGQHVTDSHVRVLYSTEVGVVYGNDVLRDSGEFSGEGTHQCDGGELVEIGPFGGFNQIR